MNRPMASRRIGFATLLFVATGCTEYRVVRRESPALSPVAELRSGMAEVCVIRPHSSGSGVPSIVRDNGRLVGGTKANSYFCYWAEPGVHEITVAIGDDIDARLGTDDAKRVELHAFAGQRYFLHHPAPHAFGLPAVDWVDETRARKMLLHCGPTELAEVPPSEKLPDRTPIAPAVARRAP